MMYIIMFIISITLYYLSIKYKDDKKKSSLLFIYSILTPCILAAMRADSVGTDINVYVKPLYEAALRYPNIFDYITAVHNVRDILYLFITHICANIFKSLPLLLFTCELLIVAPIFVAIKKKFKSNVSGIAAIILFFLFFYNQSLNMIRQSIAIAFVILGHVYLEEKKKPKFFICAIVAFLFHSSAIISIPLYFLYELINSDYKNKSKLKVGIIIVLIIALLAFPLLIQLIPKFEFLSKYHIYATEYVRESFDFSFINTFLYGLTALYLFIVNKKKKLTNDYYIFGGFICLIVLQFGALVMYAERIIYYLYYPIVLIGVPTLFKEKIKINKIIDKFDYRNIFIIIYILYWIYWIVILNYNGTLPFVIR